MVAVPRPQRSSVNPQPRSSAQRSAPVKAEHGALEFRPVERPAVTRSSALKPEEVQLFLETMETGGAVYGRFADLDALKKARYLLYQKAQQRGWKFRSRVTFETCEMEAWAIQGELKKKGK